MFGAGWRHDHDVTDRGEHVGEHDEFDPDTHQHVVELEHIDVSEQCLDHEADLVIEQHDQARPQFIVHDATAGDGHEHDDHRRPG